MNVNRRLFLSHCALAATAAAALPVAALAPHHPAMQFRTLTVFRDGKLLGRGLPFSAAKAQDIVLIDNEQDPNDPDRTNIFYVATNAERTQDPYHQGDWCFQCRELTCREALDFVQKRKTG